MDKALNTLGLAYRAKKTILGEDVLKLISKVKLLIIASDISEKSKERLIKKCFFYGIDYLDIYSSQQISNALGKNNIKVVGIVDEGFKELIFNK